MSGRAVKSVRMADQVAEALLERIRRDQLAPGHRLATEKELGEEFGVSRTVVREATRLLLARGIVEVGSGRGLVVAEVGPDVASESLELFLQARAQQDYLGVHEIREILEVEAARRAAERADEPAREGLTAAHERMRELIGDADVEALSLADVAFHRRLAGATGNDIFVVLLDAIAPALIVPRRTNLVRPDARREALRAHGAILEAVLARDPEGAAEAMQKHLGFVIARWSRETHAADD